MASKSTKEAGRTMTGNDLLVVSSSSPSGGRLLPLLVVFGSVLVGPLTPIVAAQTTPDRKEKAVLDIVVLQRRNGTLVLSDTIQLTGVFSSAGTVEYAKGYLRQIHTCADESDGLWAGLEYNWMAVFKLLEPQEEHLSPFCAQPYDKAKLAIEKGAKAVIVDVRDNEAAARQLRRSRVALSQPVIIVRGKDAGHLRRILLWEVEAVGHIKTATDDQEVTVVNEQSNNKDYYNMAIFLGVLIVFSIISIFIILQLRRKWRPREESVTEKTKRILKKMGTNRYCPTIDMWKEQTSDACAICLEEYATGQELRVLPCGHEFHRECIDPWLLNNPTCPLCLYNIIECPPPSSKTSAACATNEPAEQYDFASAYNLEMAPFGNRYSVRPQASLFTQRSCFRNNMRSVRSDRACPSQLYENPRVNEVYEGLLQKHETVARSRPDLARQNSLGFHDFGRKTASQRTKIPKHVRQWSRRPAVHQAPCLVSTLSSKVGVFTSGDSSPNRILPFSCGGQLAYPNNVEPVYACRTLPFYSFSGQSDADVSNLSADDERSQFCRNCSCDGGTTTCSVRGSDAILGDIHGFSSQATDGSLEAKIAPSLLAPFRNSPPLSSLPNTHLAHCSTDLTAFNLARCHAFSGRRRPSTDSGSCESLDSVTVPSSDVSLCKLHYCNEQKRLASLPHIETLCNSPGFHKRCFSSTRRATRMDGVNFEDDRVTNCDDGVSYLWPNEMESDVPVSYFPASLPAGLGRLNESGHSLAETRNFARCHLAPFWDTSSEHSLQLSTLSLADSQSSFST